MTKLQEALRHVALLRKEAPWAFDDCNANSPIPGAILLTWGDVDALTREIERLTVENERLNGELYNAYYY